MVPNLRSTIRRRNLTTTRRTYCDGDAPERIARVREGWLRVIAADQEMQALSAMELLGRFNYAAHLLGDLKDPRGVELLISLLNDDEVDEVVPWSLAEMGHQEIQFRRPCIGRRRGQTRDRRHLPTALSGSLTRPLVTDHEPRPQRDIHDNDAVRRRTREIGVRAALGAGPWRIARLIFLEATYPAAAGLRVAP